MKKNSALLFKKAILLAVHVLLVLGLSGCDHPPPKPRTEWQTLAARDDGHTLERQPLYRVLVPAAWMRKDPLLNESIADTMKSICEFSIQEGDQPIRLTIHTFPFSDVRQRIPPQAQLARWKRQFDQLDPLHTFSATQSQGGFSGLFFEGTGLLQGKPTTMIGWSMQLAPGYERQLSLERHPQDRLKKADYTIKATGNPEAMQQHRSVIMAFAQSFELIDELPNPI